MKQEQPTDGDGHLGNQIKERERELRVYPPIHKLGYGGRWLRQQLLTGILSGSPVLVGIQRLRFPLLNKIMLGVSFLGEEEFYTLLIPLVMWVWNARLGTLMALLMALAFYCTGFLKNMLCLPRPPVPPVVPLQHSQDWSLPSHHALLSVNIPWYIWFYLTLHGPLSLPVPSSLLFSGIALWSFLVMFSRMYLGVHSPADILSGGIVGCLLLAIWLQVDLTVDRLICESGGDTVLVFSSVAMVLLWLHPDPPPTTIIYDETVALVGVAWGVVVGRALGPAHVTMALFEARTPKLWVLGMCCVLRYVVGLMCLGLAKTVMKTVATGVLAQLCKLAGIPCTCQKRVSQVTHLKVHYSSSFITLDKPPIHEASAKPFKWSVQRPLNLQVAVRLLTYGSMGLVVVLIAPYLFTLLAI